MSNTKTKVSKEYEFTHVASHSRRGFWTMLVVMLGFSFFSASMWAGGTSGTALTSPMFILSVLVGNLLLGAYTGSLAYIAAKTGLSTHLLAHYSFGQKGSYLASLILGITQVGWFGVGVAMFAIPVHKVLPDVPLSVLVWGSGLLMTATAWFGIKALTILSAIAVPAIAILGFMSVGKAFGDFGGLEAWLNVVPTQEMSLSSAIGICIASFISGGSLTPDFTRFAKTPKISVSTTVTAFFIGNSLMFFFGAVGASFYQLSDIADVMLKQGMIVWAIVVLGLNIWTTNDNAIYGSGLGFANITKLPKKFFVLINGVLGTAAAIFLYDNFVGWLNFLNVLIPSIGGVLIADYFFVHRRHYAHMDKHPFVTIRWSAIAAWAFGALASFYLPGISSLNSVITAMVTYWLMSRFVDKPERYTEND